MVVCDNSKLVSALVESIADSLSVFKCNAVNFSAVKCTLVIGTAEMNGSNNCRITKRCGLNFVLSGNLYLTKKIAFRHTRDKSTAVKCTAINCSQGHFCQLHCVLCFMFMCLIMCTRPCKS